MSEDSTFTPPEVIHGDCIAEMAAMAAAGRRFSSIVTDPPYGIGFMNKSWDDADNVAFRPETWRLALDLLEPGGMLAAFGGSRTQHRMACAIEDAGFEIRDCALWLYGTGFPKNKNLLKPAYEPIILARRSGPMRPLNIDGCRIGDEIRTMKAEVPNMRRSDRGNSGATNDGRDAENWTAYKAKTGRIEKSYVGRFPANILHDGDREVLDLLGSAERFFYCAKVSIEERAGSNHPTIKPLSLMRWVARLITPPEGTILDPFAGSGTTLAAAHMEGFHAVGIEREAEYVADIRRRIAALAAAAKPAPLSGLFAGQDAAE